jgi:predicted pyridoxine 5'-phosphate oxidase superfamily flavin-nucleotide-binding protein
MENSGQSPWHAGERAWHKRLGLDMQMQELGMRVIREAMPDQHRSFFAQLPFILAGYETDSGQVWASLLAGPPGFVSSPDARQLKIATVPAAADPIAQALRPGAGLAVLGIELPTRRRNRANGKVTQFDETGITLAVQQSFGNCPKYIEKRDYGVARSQGPVSAAPISGMDEETRRVISNAGTFFVASIAGPGALPDISHRGGRHGFVATAHSGTLTVPDYTGNNFFNTLGNFMLDPRAGLLFPDFSSGDLLQLTGKARVDASVPTDLELPGAERVWQFEAEGGQWLRNALPIDFAAGEISKFAP